MAALTEKEEAKQLKKKIRKKTFENREISWIRFNERVLEEAEKMEVPLGERLNFASIYQTNLDEFFMVRVGKLLHRERLEGDLKDSKSGMTPKEQIHVVCKKVKKLVSRRDFLFAGLMDELKLQGICLLREEEIAGEHEAALRDYFLQKILPDLDLGLVSQGSAFPFLKNKVVYACAILQNEQEEKLLGVVPCDKAMANRLIPVGEEGAGIYALAEEVIFHFLPEAFADYQLTESTLVRVTRNADIDADASYTVGFDYREHMEETIAKRNSMPPVRMEFTCEKDDQIADMMSGCLGVSRVRTFFYHEPLDLGFLSDIRDLLPQDKGLFYASRMPQASELFDKERPVLAQILESDKILSYPYESIEPFISMLQEAAEDESVVSLQMTLYRMAKQSRVVDALIKAAENGKEVTVLVELKARFDEEANISWAKKMEEAGCHVIYGIKGYKVHSKLCLITMVKDGKTYSITQVGTGNYNEKTAKIYTDLCMMSTDETMARDAQKVFDALKKGEFLEESEQLLVAPLILRSRILKMIDEQIVIAKEGGEGYIGLKMNSLSDTKIMNKLVEASMAGVHVDMIIRGVCCLKAGVKGYTDNIRIISIVGRFLEHARVFIFGTPEQNQRIYLGSADLMKRNTSNRVEIAAPILDEKLKEKIRTMFEIQLSDNMQAREMLEDGTYVPVRNAEAPVNSQEYFYEHAYRMAGELLPEEES